MYMTPGTRGIHSMNTPKKRSPTAVKPKKKFGGLGDVVHAVLKIVGIDKLVKKATKGKDCGCAKRRSALNNAIPFTKGGI